MRLRALWSEFSNVWLDGSWDLRELSFAPDGGKFQSHCKRCASLIGMRCRALIRAPHETAVHIITQLRL
jgi:hypothetical protein